MITTANTGQHPLQWSTSLTGQSDLGVAATTRAEKKKQAAQEPNPGGSHSRLAGEATQLAAPPTLGESAHMGPEPGLLPTEAEAAELWRHTLLLMHNSSLPSIVQQLAIEAMTLTATAWSFASQDAVEAVLMKVERRTPLTFAHPQLGILLRSIADTLAPKLWKQAKAQAEQATGTSGYTAEVQGKFISLPQAIQGWQQHFQVRTDRQCTMRNRTTEDTLRGTSDEVAELMEVIDQTRTQGRDQVRSKIMDEAGDSFYGMLYYAALWREQCHTAVQRWKIQSRMAEAQQFLSTGTQTACDHTAWETQTTTIEEHLASVALKLDRVASMAESGADPDMTAAAVRQTMEMLATHLGIKAGAIMQLGADVHQHLNHHSIRAKSDVTEAGARRIRIKASLHMPHKHMVENAIQKNHSWEQARDECIAAMQTQQQHQCPLWNKEAADTARLLVQTVRALQGTIQGHHLHHDAAQTATSTEAILIAAARLAARATQHCWKHSEATGTVAGTCEVPHPEGQDMTLQSAVITAATQEKDHQQQPAPEAHRMQPDEAETDMMYYDCQELTIQVPGYYDCEQPPAAWLPWAQKQAKRRQEQQKRRQHRAEVKQQVAAQQAKEWQYSEEICHQMTQAEQAAN